MHAVACVHTCAAVVHAHTAPLHARLLSCCSALREGERKCPGFQRLRMAQYDDLRKKLSSSHGGGGLGRGEVAAAPRACSCPCCAHAQLHLPCGCPSAAYQVAASLMQHHLTHAIHPTHPLVTMSSPRHLMHRSLLMKRWRASRSTATTAAQTRLLMTRTLACRPTCGPPRPAGRWAALAAPAAAAAATPGACGRACNARLLMVRRCWPQAAH